MLLLANIFLSDLLFYLLVHTPSKNEVILYNYIKLIKLQIIIIIICFYESILGRV